MKKTALELRHYPTFSRWRVYMLNFEHFGVSPVD